MDLRIKLVVPAVLISILWSFAQTTESLELTVRPVNYDESRVPEYDLPDPLTAEDGQQVKDTVDWVSKRRPELLHLFETHVYGKAPGRPGELRFVVQGETEALNGKAIQKEVKVYFSKVDTLSMTILMFLPKDGKSPCPLFLGLNFGGNHRVNPAAREGKISPEWPVDLLIAEGYGLATICYEDIDPDFDDGFQNGIHPLFYKEKQQRPAPDQWGNIAAWAWGLGRAMDYLEQDTDVNEKQVVVIGHSRLGKAALWAAASDQRFAMVVSNNSGCGGAALFRREFGETIAVINKSFPHWFCQNFHQYNGREEMLPVDQHQLISLIAPRPVYIASATEDLWADPKGEFLSGLHASQTYALWGLDGLPDGNMPPPDTPLLSGYIGYHIRTGKHAILRYDWEQYIRFANKHFGDNLNF